MAVLVLGATGTTGKLVAKLLLAKGYEVSALVRSLDRVDSELLSHKCMSVTEQTILDLTENDQIELVRNYDAVICCLGHNLTFKGIYGHPRRLVADTTQRICRAITTLQREKPIKFILMSTTGYQNTLGGETVTWQHSAIIELLRLTLPPHVDNEEAARYLQHQIAEVGSPVEWVAVRPDSLTDESRVTEYTLHPSPTSDPLFASRQTSRINVAHFMAELVSNDSLWQQWKFDLPVIYNKI
ncbi:NAD(P)-binding oxidoreductase [Vibrio sp. SCSIO 43136]|uniref:NAD(P)-binding oxidoreductase n=1 Tax=Vibrio sp. SCSIO 43136 TaxID=2819101 RepID=UPI002076370D|nr:NAD(P)-binding oxidoreductase [Vibrio sp. SCSIO 43136]USD68040.1 SDR family oxidoreductase [Vibrio sp. SCSIO 43136]